MSDLATLPGAGNLSSKKKGSFWSQREGGWGILVNLLTVGGIGFGLLKVLPFIILLLKGAIEATSLALTLIPLALLLAGLIYVILDKQVHKMVWHVYRIIRRKIVGKIVELDPIGILNNQLDYLREQRNTMRQQISILRGRMVHVKRTMDGYEESRLESLRIVQQARRAGKEKPARLHARKAGRRQKSTAKLADLYSRLEFLYRTLNRFAEATDFTIEDMEDEIAVKSEEFEAIRTGHSAFRSAVSVLTGNPDQRAMFEHALEYMAEDVAMRVGEIDDFLEVSSGILDSIDLQNMAAETAAFEQLDAWEKRSQNIFLGQGEQKLLAASASSASTLEFHDGDIDREAIPVEIRGQRPSKPPYAKFLEIGKEPE